MSPWLGPVKTAYQTGREFLMTFSELCAVSSMYDGSILAEIPTQNALFSPWINFVSPWNNLQFIIPT